MPENPAESKTPDTNEESQAGRPGDVPRHRLAIDDYLTPEELIARLRAKGVRATRQTLAMWRCEKRGPGYTKIGRTILYPPAEVDRWLASQFHHIEAPSTAMMASRVAATPTGGIAGHPRQSGAPVIPPWNKTTRPPRFGRHTLKRERNYHNAPSPEK